MKLINEFHTADPVKLARELADLETNADRALRDLAFVTAPKLSPDSFLPLGTITIAPLLPDHQLSIDTSQASAIAVLPALDPVNFGKRFVLIKRVAVNQIAVSCQDATVTHNAGAFPVLGPGAAVRVFYCDSRGYYS